MIVQDSLLEVAVPFYPRRSSAVCAYNILSIGGDFEDIHYTTELVKLLLMAKSDQLLCPALMGWAATRGRKWR